MWEWPILAQLEGIELDDATIAGVVAGLGSAPRPVTLDKARIERQMRDLALDHAAGRLEDEGYLQRLHEFRAAGNNHERTEGGARRQARRRLAPRPLAAWSAADPGRRRPTCSTRSTIGSQSPGVGSCRRG